MTLQQPTVLVTEIKLAYMLLCFSVEKPFLKPVVLAGPSTGERRKLLEMLVAEFPEVFAWPRQHTTRPPDEHADHIGVDCDELQLVTDKPSTTPRLGGASSAGMLDGLGPAGTTAGMERGNSSAISEQKAPGSAADSKNGSSDADAGGSSSNPASRDNSLQDKSLQVVLGPPPVVLSKDEFEATAAGGKFLEWHADLFKHKLVTHKHGYSMEHVREVIKSGGAAGLEAINPGPLSTSACVRQRQWVQVATMMRLYLVGVFIGSQHVFLEARACGDTCGSTVNNMCCFCHLLLQASYPC